MPSLIVAHRGNTSDLPENSLADPQKVLKSGADALELDVRICASGEPVVFHDRSLRRLYRIKRPISRVSLAELKALKNDLHPNIFTLEETLVALAPSAPRHIFIDIKNWDRSAILAVIAAIESCCDRGLYEFSRLSIVGHSWELLRLIKRTNPSISTGQTILPIPMPAPSMLQLAKYSRANIVNVQHHLLGSRFIERAHRAGLLVNTWTVNREEEMRWLLEAGADFITTDRVKQLAALVKKYEISGRY